MDKYILSVLYFYWKRAQSLYNLFIDLLTRRNIELTPFVVEVDLSMLVKLPNQNFKQAIPVFYAWTSRSLAAQLNHNWIRLNCVFKKKTKKNESQILFKVYKKKGWLRGVNRDSAASMKLLGHGAKLHTKFYFH
jgi:hypothetical protein